MGVRVKCHLNFRSQIRGQQKDGFSVIRNKKFNTGIIALAQIFTFVVTLVIFPGESLSQAGRASGRHRHRKQSRGVPLLSGQRDARAARRKPEGELEQWEAANDEAAVGREGSQDQRRASFGGEVALHRDDREAGLSPRGWKQWTAARIASRIPQLITRSRQIREDDVWSRSAKHCAQY